MGIRDWLRPKKECEPVVTEPVKIELPEMDREELLEQTLSALDGEEEELQSTPAIEIVPEYDAGEVEVEDLMSDEMSSNYELNTVEETEVEDLLEGAEIIGDLPEEVDL